MWTEAGRRRALAVVDSREAYALRIVRSGRRTCCCSARGSGVGCCG